MPEKKNNKKRIDLAVLSTVYLLILVANIRFDSAENEPTKVFMKLCIAPFPPEGLPAQ